MKGMGIVEVPVEAYFCKNCAVCCERLRLSELDCLRGALSDIVRPLLTCWPIVLSFASTVTRT